MVYRLWDKVSQINGCNAEYFLNGVLKGYKGDVILIENNGRVSNVEMKDVLADIYQIDKNLPLDEFMSKYEEILNAE